MRVASVAKRIYHYDWCHTRQGIAPLIRQEVAIRRPSLGEGCAICGRMIIPQTYNVYLTNYRRNTCFLTQLKIGVAVLTKRPVLSTKRISSIDIHLMSTISSGQVSSNLIPLLACVGK